MAERFHYNPVNLPHAILPTLDAYQLGLAKSSVTNFNFTYYKYDVFISYLPTYLHFSMIIHVQLIERHVFTDIRRLINIELFNSLHVFLYDPILAFI